MMVGADGADDTNLALMAVILGERGRHMGLMTTVDLRGGDILRPAQTRRPTLEPRSATDI